MAGKILKMERLSYVEIEKLDRRKTAFLIAISPLEEHGPHLPVGVDAFNAYFFAELTAKTIVEQRPDYDAVLFPLLPLGTQVYRYIGSFSVAPRTIYDIVFSTGKSLAMHGFKNIFVISAHGTPKQIVAIEAACLKIKKKYRANMICLSGKMTEQFLKGELYADIAVKLNRDLTDEEKHLLKYDTHAGWWETAMMLKLYPDLVDESYLELKPYLRDWKTKKVVSDGVPWRGYVGAPAKADAAFAEASIEVFAERSRELINRSLDGEDVTAEVLSPFYRYRIFHPFFRRQVALAVGGLILIIIIIFAIITIK